MIQSCLLKLATVWLQDCSTSNVQNSVLYLKQQKNKTPVFMVCEECGVSASCCLCRETEQGLH